MERVEELGIISVNMYRYPRRDCDSSRIHGVNNGQ